MGLARLERTASRRGAAGVGLGSCTGPLAPIGEPTPGRTIGAGPRRHPRVARVRPRTALKARLKRRAVNRTGVRPPPHYNLLHSPPHHTTQSIPIKTQTCAPLPPSRLTPPSHPLGLYQPSLP